MVIRRDKLLQKYTSIDLVKYFARKYEEINGIEYFIVYARDCTLMNRVFEKFDKATVSIKRVFEFIDLMFDEYPKRERTEPIDIRFLLAMTDFYLYKKAIKKLPKTRVTPKLTPELLEWLRQEKLKWSK